MTPCMSKSGHRPGVGSTNPGVAQWLADADSLRLERYEIAAGDRFELSFDIATYDAAELELDRWVSGPHELEVVDQQRGEGVCAFDCPQAEALDLQLE